MSTITAPLTVPRNDPTSATALRNLDTRPSPRPAAHAVIYDAAARVRRGSEPLQVTLWEIFRAKYDGR